MLGIQDGSALVGTVTVPEDTIAEECTFSFCYMRLVTSVTLTAPERRQLGGHRMRRLRVYPIQENYEFAFQISVIGVDAQAKEEGSKMDDGKDNSKNNVAGGSSGVYF